MTSKDAMQFPFIASVALFSIYLAFRLFSKENVNLLLTGYFLILGVLALTHLVAPLMDKLIPSRVPKIPFHLLFLRGAGAQKEPLIDFEFSTYDIICLFVSTLIGVWYLLQKHWIANNLFGLAFAINGIELLHLNDVMTGCILLSGLFFYDIFWVFGTNVMVTVAKNFNAPIKLVFPQDILTHGWNASNFAMLGLGDIVIPGIFIALLMRFDNSLKRKSHLYFWATYAAYFSGLLLTLVILHTFKHAQPVLLYLVPLCLGTPILLALIKGDLKKLFAYEDFSDAQKQGNNKKSSNGLPVSASEGSPAKPKKKDTKKSKKTE